MSDKQNPYRAIALTSGIVAQLSGATIVGIFIGRWLDQHFSTSPLFLIIGLFSGLAAGVYGTIYLVKNYTGDS
ncbi:MAG: AtpZ/AtpI family protein [Bacillaceae bacterium]|nr:AtpZ/AtpI family protein [Bacillaceae bacterium]